MSLPDVEQLTREWKKLQARYGIAESSPELERLERGFSRRRARIGFLRDQIEELNAEVRVLEEELVGLAKLLGLVLEEAVEKVKTGEGEGWSPVPVLGFRIWVLRDGRFRGYREAWRHREMTAHCLTTGSDFEVPHTDGRCGDPPCGIYLAKDVADLLNAHVEFDLDEIAVGLVGLSGKVVEHERGYRGEHATVMALALVVDAEVCTVSDVEEIAAIFEKGVPVNDVPLKDPGKARARIIDFMREERRLRSQWTSASRSG
ncbi:MAG: hypothetical protein ACE5F5_01640 [Acidimicrobiia bacterium]